MIYAYSLKRAGAERVEIGPAAVMPSEALWLDLFEPTAEERNRVEAAYSLILPTREEMAEIEPSSRLFVEGDAVFMTGTFLLRADEPNPSVEPITFCLVRRTLISMRYSAPRPLEAFSARLIKGIGCTTGEEVFFGILEAFVDRIADVIERVGIENDRVSTLIFHKAGRTDGERRDLQVVIRMLGRTEDLVAKARESLLSLTRLMRFHAATFEAETKKESKSLKGRVRSLTRDIESLTEHAGHESHTINFLLDATLGMVNIEQNRIIKLFSVVAVIFLPPTLVASIYGMNFQHMPELEWIFGYPWALGLMVVSAVAPLLWFRRKKWL
jgi:magnesium transporter